MNTLKREYPYHLMLIPGILVTLVYQYGPMFGVVMAFQNYEPLLGFFRSEWVGLENFQYIFNMSDFRKVLRNTVYIAGLKIIFSLMVPLLLALLLNELRLKWFVRTVQTTIFLPYFLSWTILGGIVMEIFSLRGPVNGILSAIGIDPIMFLGSNTWFPWILVGSDTWQGMGYNMIIFLAAIMGINPNLYEAAEMDGAGKWKQLIYVTLPGMTPMIVLILTLSLGGILSAGFQQILVLYNSTVYESGDVIDTFVYRLGIFSQQYSPAAAVGMFQSVVSLLLVCGSYYLAYRFSNYRIF